MLGSDYSILQAVASMLRLYSYMLLVYGLLPLVMHKQHYPTAIRWLQSMVEPVLIQIRKVIPPIRGFDISFIPAIFISEIIRDSIYTAL